MLTFKAKKPNRKTYPKELNHTKPQVKQIPKIISFLGYSPKIEQNKIKRYRIERGITQKEMAKILNINPATLARVERGNRRITKKVKNKLGNF